MSAFNNAAAGDQNIKQEVRHWLAQRGLSVTGPGVMRDTDGKRVPIPSVVLDWRLAKLANVAAGQGISEGLREVALEKVIVEDLEALMAAKLATVAYNPEQVANGAEQLTLWLRGATGSDNIDELNFYSAIIKHYIWQVKRKAARLPVTYHLCPLLVGGQGTGKTTAVNRLNSPLATFTIKGRPVDEIIDPRNYLTLSENLIVFLDEMGRAKNACIDHLKTIITADSIDYRPMRTNSIVRVEQSCTFIGASNKELKNVISDITGMRRFSQLNCVQVAASDERHVMVNSADIVAIWQSVNELQELPYTAAIKEQLATHQEDLRTQSTIEEFLANCMGAPGEQRVAATPLYQEYSEFCRTSNLYALSSPVFFRELSKTLGFEKIRNSVGTFYLVNDGLYSKVNHSTIGLSGKSSVIGD